MGKKHKAAASCAQGVHPEAFGGNTRHGPVQKRDAVSRNI